MLLLGQNKSVTHEHFDSLRIICNGAGPVKEADAQKLLDKTINKNLRFCQGKTLQLNLEYLQFIIKFLWKV